MEEKTKRMKHCDIIISGAGISGLSLLYKAMKSGIWSDQQIIVIDQDRKISNDKTISFWKKAETAFDGVISATWNKISFFSNAGEKILLDTGSYTYNSIRSIDFYKECLDYLEAFPNICFVQDKILSVSESAGHCVVLTAHEEYRCGYLFNSVFAKPELTETDQYFLQHFKGWRIRVDQELLALDEAYLMDYRTGQEHGTTFFYTLPLNNDELFVEYTIFSKALLEPAEYTDKIKIYLSEVLGISQYELLEEEFGVIPMTTYAFQRSAGLIMNIGTMGGDTRASTGYSLMNIQKTTDRILESFKLYGHPFFNSEVIGFKHKLYDATLLEVLDSGAYEGHKLFTDLFKGTKATRIFEFLDAESSLYGDIQIMISLKVAPFLRQFIKVLTRRLKS